MSQGSLTSGSKLRWSPKHKAARPPVRRERVDVLEALETRTLLSTYYVSPSGSDSAAGGSSAPWKSLQKAADNAKAGDIVHVGAGTYNSGMNFFGKAGGTASAPIQFLADPGAVITHSATANTNSSLAGINVESTGGWYVFKGFTINSDGSMERAGIRVAASSNVQVLNNTITGAYMGIFTSSSSNVLVQGNTCRNSTDQHGIYIGAGMTNAVVRGNTMYGNNWDGLHMNASNAVGPNSGALVEDNVIYGNKLAGMDIEGLTGAIFRNNLIYNNTKHGITVHSQDQTAAGDPTPPSTNNTFVNNTITGNGMFGMLFQKEDMANTVVFNNVLMSTSSYGAIGTGGSPSGLLTSDYNVVNDTFSTSLGSSKMTLAQWRSSTGQDAHSIVSSAAQLFVAPSSNDYHLKGGAPAIDKGVSSLAGRAAAPDDFAQGARPQGAGYDIGAYEYASTTPPADTTAPTISGVGSSSITSGGASVSWSTDEASDTQVDYGTTTSYGSSTALNSSMVTSHNGAIGGLAAGTTYHYRVKSRDAAGNLATSGDFTFTTAQAADTTAPTISGVGSSNVSTGGATIGWTTNESSDTQVDYGTSTSYGSSTARNSSMVTSHTAGISGLAAGTTYHYRVKSRDAAGNLAVSGDLTFTTGQAADTTAPTISGVGSSNVSGSGATVGWATNEASDTQVDFGTSTAYGSSTTLNATLLTSHSANLSGLTAGTLYHYRVKSRDAAGNLAVSGDYTFTTAATQPSGTVFSTTSNLGDFAAYTPLTASRWSVVQDGGDTRLYLNTTSYKELSGDRLGEYALAGSQSFGDFDMTFRARTGDNLTNNRQADYAVVFGYTDAKNYSYAMLNSDAASSAIFDVVNGVRTQVATSTTSAFTDAAYHDVQVSRRGQVVTVSVDGRQLLSGNNAGVGSAGRVGVGSFNDSAYFDDVNVTVPTVVPASVFSTTANQGDFAAYSPLTASRWSVTQDGGDARLFLNTTNYSELSGDRLGEYALAGTQTYADFDMSLVARTGDSLSTNGMADYAVVFGYADANNYSYAMLNSDAASSAIFDVVNGMRTQVASATTSAFTDAAYHDVQVSRRGQVVTISVDGRQLMSADDAGVAGIGQVGVGSFNDSAYFDDVNVTVPAVAAAAAPASSPFSSTRVTTSSVLDPSSTGVLA